MRRFDELVERRGSHSMKWDDLQQWFGSDEVVPMWVADMDFRSPEEVITAVRERVEHGVFGYAGNTQPYYDSIINWLNHRQNWDIKKDWICLTEGIVTAINMLIQGLSKEGDKVLIQTPVYPPFFKAINNNNRVLVENKLVYKENRYEIDFETLDKQLEGVRIFLFCSPHNPVGRVWSKEELEKIAELVIKHDCILISDEIHGDLAFKNSKFITMGRIDKIRDRIAVCTAPSKAFNIAGLHTSNIIIENEAIREQFKKVLERNGATTRPNVLGMVALMAAYNNGEDWLDEVIEYVEGNFKFLREYLNENIPSLKLVKAEGTYLAWLDCSSLGIRGKELEEFFIDSCKVGVVPGYSFGKDGENFVRLNLGCSRRLLEIALKRIEQGAMDILL